MRLFRPLFFLRWLYPGTLFRIKTSDRIICLTFDDGPNPETTSALLEILKKNNIRAVFFCSGLAAEKYPSLIELIRNAGHLIGNHGYHHYNGWVTSSEVYCTDVNYASQFTSGKLFRPPYGRLRLSQYKKLRKTFRIIFWDLMSYDFDNRFGAAKSLAILKKKIRPGSIIVLHDKPGSSSINFLNDFIGMAVERGYSFTIPEFR